MGLSYSLFGSGRIKRSHEDNEDDDDEVESVLQTPVRKKLKTVEFIYQQLFVNGENSDVTICALGREWHLHKIYLSQSQYFASMFNGKWKESKESKIALNIPNKMITSSSLEQVFASLYRDEMEIKPCDVVQLLAAATLLQLDSLVGRCAEVMCENINTKTVVKFYTAAEQNGLMDVREECLSWLKKNLLNFANATDFLKTINLKLMTSLISSDDLYVIQGESDVYSLLKKWIFLRLNVKYTKNTDGTLKEATEKFFQSYRNPNRSFLETVRGRKFLPVFLHLRISHILTSEKSLKLLFDDFIIPKKVLNDVMALQWRMQIVMEHSLIAAKDENQVLNEEEFNRRAIRFGRVLPQDVTHCWRWSGFYFGVDVLLSYKHRAISIKRNCTSQALPYSVNMKADRIIFYRLTVLTLDKHRTMTWSASTGVKKIVMQPDDESIILRIPVTVRFPLTVLFWYSVTPIDEKCNEIMICHDQVWNEFLNPSSTSSTASESSSDSESDNDEEGQTVENDIA